jgi:hypothetical protein
VKYRVVIDSSARSDIDAAYDWIKERALLVAIKAYSSGTHRQGERAARRRSDGLLDSSVDPAWLSYL